MENEPVIKYVARWKALTNVGYEVLSQLSRDLVSLDQIDNQPEDWGVMSSHVYLPAMTQREFRNKVQEAISELTSLVKEFERIRLRVAQLKDRTSALGIEEQVWQLMSSDEAMKFALVDDLARSKLTFTTLLYYIDAWQHSPLFAPDIAKLGI